ncbi:MAG: cystathionine beta-lyase [SAR324 cluster bacterium]|nr:cystathionine beta-lyase [SAR324 cluster bacterium]
MKDDTLLVHAGRDPERNFGIVNPPLYRASTILYPTLAEFKARSARKANWFSYGIDGTPTNFALADAIARLEGGHRTLLTSSGQSVINIALLGFLKAGDHVLVADTVYGPTRNFCSGMLSRFGVETTYYDPLLGAEIAELMRENTRVVFMESPGTHTFEVQDVPAIARVARERGVVSMIDNTWASPVCFKPIAHGVDISLHAVTKYLSGHSDLLLGCATAADEETFQTLREGMSAVGDSASPDVCYQALRGMRTMGLRLRHQEQAALRIAGWLAARPEVKRVLHPGLPDDPGHALWKRDFSGASGLFGVLLHTESEDAAAAMIDPMQYFKIGNSWGGYESLIIPAYPGGNRTATSWTESGFLLRISIGLEDVEDLTADLEAGLARLNEALKAAS